MANDEHVAILKKGVDAWNGWRIKNPTSVKAILETTSSLIADLSGAQVHGGYLSKANLIRDADLSGANLSGANLSGADLSGADLRGADLRGADLRGANLITAKLIEVTAELIGAQMPWADLSGEPRLGEPPRGERDCVRSAPATARRCGIMCAASAAACTSLASAASRPSAGSRASNPRRSARRLCAKLRRWVLGAPTAA